MKGEREPPLAAQPSSEFMGALVEVRSTTSILRFELTAPVVKGI